MEVCSKWVGVFGRILSGFWVFYALFWRRRWLLNGFLFRHYRHFCSFLGHFWPFGGYKGPFLGPKWGHFGRIWTIFGSIRRHFGATQWSCCHRLGLILGRFGVVLTTVWGLFGPIFEPFLRSFCDFLWCFGKLDTKFTKGKKMQFSAKVHQNYAKLCKNMPLFAFKNTCFD